MPKITREDAKTLVALQAIASSAQDQITEVGRIVANMLGWTPDDPKISEFVNGQHILDFYEAGQIEEQS